jgi:predicted dehydrogenase
VTAAGRVRPVRVGVVGFGLRASLARAVVDSGLGEVTAVLDPSERGRSDARSALGADLPIAESLEALLASGVEAIMVLSPDDTHPDVAVAALRAGVPVF